MTITSTPCIRDGNLAVRGKVVVSQVPDNIMVKPVIAGSAFIGATSATASCHHVLGLGVLE